jgi:hypothetical protein
MKDDANYGLICVIGIQAAHAQQRNIIAEKDRSARMQPVQLPSGG